MFMDKDNEQGVSILVFLEPLLRLVNLAHTFSGTKFQSLFFWNHYLDKSNINISGPYFSVSILVFLEPLLRPGQINKYENLHLKVSILVFLEPLLRPDVMLYDAYAEYCFNPCFSGTTT